MNRLVKKEQLYALFIAHSREILREPGVLFWGILFPILMALGLGIAFTQKSEITTNIAVIENKNNSPQIINNFLQKNTVKTENKKNAEYKLSLKDEKLGNNNFIFQKTSWEYATVLLKRGEVNIVLEEKEGEIEYNFDPVNSEAQLAYLKLLRLFENKEKQTDNNVEPLTLTGTRYIDFLLPGLIAMGIMMSSVWGLGYGIIDKRSKKLLRRMIATPMKKSHFLVAFMTVRTVMNFIEALLLFIFAYLVFDVIIQGNLLALFLIFTASNIAFAGIAILTASRTANTEVGNGLINAVVTPMIVLSGIFFSYHNFPDWTLPFIKILPLTLLADGMREIFIEGAGLEQIALPVLVLTAMGIIFFVIGIKSFKWH